MFRQNHIHSVVKVHFGNFESYISALVTFIFVELDLLVSQLTGSQSLNLFYGRFKHSDWLPNFVSTNQNAFNRFGRSSIIEQRVNISKLPKMNFTFEINLMDLSL